MDELAKRLSLLADDLYLAERITRASHKLMQEAAAALSGVRVPVEPLPDPADAAAVEQVYDARTNIEARVGKEAAGYMIACRLSSMEAHEWTARLEGDLQKLIEDAGVLCAAAGAKMFLPDEFSRCASAIETAKQTLHALAAAKGEE